MDKQLYRSCKNRILGGVAGGLGEYFNIDPVLIRIILVLLVFAGGIGFLFYFIAWVIIPEDPKCGSPRPLAEEMGDKAEEVHKGIKSITKNNDGRIIIGLIILILGVLLLLNNLVGFALWHNFWPIVLIVIGLVFLLNVRKGDR